MGSTQSSSDMESNPTVPRRRPSRLDRNKSFSHQTDRNKIQITQQIIQDIQCAVTKLINDQPISLNYIIQDIECKLNEEVIRQILVTLSMKQGLRQFQSDSSLNPRNQNDSIVQDVVQQTLIELFLPPFFDNFSFKSINLSSIPSQDAKKLLLDQLKKDIQDFKEFCYKFFAIIFRKINLSTKGSLVQQVILETLFRPCQIDDHIARKKVKEFIVQYYRIYETYYASEEQLLQAYLPSLDIRETDSLLKFKKDLINNNYYPKCQRKMKKLFQITSESNFLTISDSLLILIDAFNNHIFSIAKSLFSDGADSRQVLNINFISLFDAPGFYTCCNFILDNFENILQPTQKHLITTLCISFEQIMHYIREQCDGIQMNMLTQTSLGDTQQFQSVFSGKQCTIS